MRAHQCHQPKEDEAVRAELADAEEEEEGSLPRFVLGGSHGGERSFPSSFSALTSSALILAATCQPVPEIYWKRNIRSIS